MRRLFALLMLVLMASVAADDTQAAKAAATSFLAQVDAGKYAAAYKASSSMVHQAVNEKDFVGQVQQVRGQLGALKSRKLAKATPAKDLPGSPPGTRVVVLEYTSDFANKKGVTELVTPMLEPDGSWKVAGYRFR